MIMRCLGSTVVEMPRSPCGGILARLSFTLAPLRQARLTSEHVRQACTSGVEYSVTSPSLSVQRRGATRRSIWQWEKGSVEGLRAKLAAQLLIKS